MAAEHSIHSYASTNCSASGSLCQSAGSRETRRVAVVSPLERSHSAGRLVKEGMVTMLQAPSWQLYIGDKFAHPPFFLTMANERLRRTCKVSSARRG